MQAKKFSDLFAFDLDGTLVHPTASGVRTISAELIELIFEVAKRAHIVVATGRRYNAAEPDFSLLPPMPFTVIHNGLVIKDSNAKTVESREMARETAVEIAEILQSESFDPFFVSDSHAHGIDYSYLEEGLARSATIQRIAARPFQKGHILKSLNDLKSVKFPILEVATLGQFEDLELLKQKIESRLPKSVRPVLVRNIGTSGIAAMEIFDRESSKWSAVQKVKVKLDASKVIAVGDDGNDYEMLKFSDIGVAMSHADDYLKAVAKRQVNGSTGLCEFLKEYLDS